MRETGHHCGAQRAKFHILKECPRATRRKAVRILECFAQRWSAVHRPERAGRQATILSARK